MSKPFMRFHGDTWSCRSHRDNCEFISSSKNPFNAFIGWADENYRRLSK